MSDLFTASFCSFCQKGAERRLRESTLKTMRKFILLFTLLSQNFFGFLPPQIKQYNALFRYENLKYRSTKFNQMESGNIAQKKETLVNEYEYIKNIY